MSNEKINRLERMMENLIEITANVNTTISELSQDNKELKQRINILEQYIDNIMSQAATKDGIAHLEYLSNSAMDIIEATYREVESASRAIDILAGKMVRQEVELQKLKQTI